MYLRTDLLAIVGLITVVIGSLTVPALAGKQNVVSDKDDFFARSEVPCLTLLTGLASGRLFYRILNNWLGQKLIIAEEGVEPKSTSLKGAPTFLIVS